jgi:poly-gamma-glutamate synthesis protein (capsule biosynthesis protein)
VRLLPKKAITPSLTKTEIVIAAVGDVMMPASIQAAIAGNEHGYDLLFEKIAQDLGAADITFANLETPVDHTIAVSGYPKFNAPPALLAALKKAGVHIVSIANNHTMDAGSDGLKRTLDNIERAGLVFIGAGRTKAEASEIKHLKARGVNVAFLSYTYSTNQHLPRRAAGEPGVNIIGIGSEPDLDRAAASVRQARSGADLVVVSVHWGEEYATKPTNWQRRVASELVEAGADIILGHHPHVLQPIESFAARDGRLGLIAFSLGNFISSQNAGVTYENKNHTKALRGDGIILSVTAVKEGGKTRVERAEFLPIWSLREPNGKGTVYRPVSLGRELSMLSAKQKRNSTEDGLMRLLSYRQELIIQKLTGKPE